MQRFSDWLQGAANWGGALSLVAMVVGLASAMIEFVNPTPGGVWLFAFWLALTALSAVLFVIQRGALKRQRQELLNEESTDQLDAVEPAAAAAAGKLAVTIYLDPPERERILADWRFNRPIADGALAFDYKPMVDKKVRRATIATGITSAASTTHRIEVAAAGEGGHWHWAFGDHTLMHEDGISCRFVLVLPDGKEVYSRFAIAERNYKERPNVVGEALLFDDFK